MLLRPLVKSEDDCRESAITQASWGIPRWQ